jgi:REP element-mobilizing transposase RayT
MATPRSQLIDPEYSLHYHIVSRCVRRSWLCGKDKYSARNYEHRKTWLERRIHHLSKYFAVAIDAYAIMSNHFHLVLYYDPKECYRWSKQENVCKQSHRRLSTRPRNKIRDEKVCVPVLHAWRKPTTALVMLLIGFDLLEGTAQILALTSQVDWLAAKQILTPVKLGCYLVGLVLVVLGWLRWLVLDRGRATS